MRSFEFAKKIGFHQEHLGFAQAQRMGHPPFVPFSAMEKSTMYPVDDFPATTSRVIRDFPARLDWRVYDSILFH